MRNLVSAGIAAFVLLSLGIAAPAAAGPIEDGSAAESRGDYATAMRLWQPLADEGNADAQNRLAVMYQLGRGVPQNYALAVNWYRKAADQGYVPAQYNLGIMYQRGRGVPQDYAAAVSWYRKAADQGHVGAQINLGFMHEDGMAAYNRGDYATAMGLWVPMADAGEVLTQFSLGRMYKDGHGVPQDDAAALSWFRKAADQGHAGAQANLASMHADGRGVPQDYASAASWYRKAAEQGDAGAQNALGVMYSSGRLPTDHAAAAGWFQKAADQGNADAQFNLGQMYEAGRGVPHDHAAALSWLRKSAEQGNASAQQILARMSETGPGTTAKAEPAKASPVPAQPANPSPAVAKTPPMPDIVFYLARGETDACGRGCSQWIAAEGKIDPAAAQRLRRLLAKVGHRKPPVFFHSPGGSVVGSIELGRLIRDQKLEVSVAHTVPRGCDRDKPLDKSCEALKRSGQELESDFDFLSAMCNSACVYAFAGGVARFVPPWVKLAVHDVGVDSNKPSLRGAALAESKRTIHERIVEYLREMGIDKGLFTVASAVPYESARPLERDELARFGLDRREFAETAWYFVEKPTIAMSKLFFVRSDNGGEHRYRNGIVNLACAVGDQVRFVVAQQREDEKRESEDPHPVMIDLNSQRIVLQYQTPSSEFRLNSALLSAGMFDVLGHESILKVSGVDQRRSDASEPAMKLNMDGFLDASVKFRKSCNESARNAMMFTWPQ
jgi:TPR repeat protein